MNVPDTVKVKLDSAGRMHSVLKQQKAAVRQSPVPDAKMRIDRLRRLLDALASNEARIADAMMSDFGYRSREQSYFAELMTTAKPLRTAIRKTAKWMRPERRSAGFPFNMLGASAAVHYQPLGVVGCVSPWNFPINLSVSPLAGILSAGNRAMLKPSEVTPASAALLEEMISSAFDPSEIAVIQGDAETAKAFVELPFDHLLYTGGEVVAKSIMRSAADNLVPLTLELGGKSPVIVGQGADLENAARKIIFGKIFNAGQICLAPDHVYVRRELLDAFAAALGRAVEEMLPTQRAGKDVVSVVNRRHADRLRNYVTEARAQGAEIVEFPSSCNTDGPGRENIVPITLILDPDASANIMREEIFGPLLPVVPYDQIEQVTHKIRQGAKPLALYYFGKSRGEMKSVLNNTQSGGVTINDVIMHYTIEDLPFGGVGPSGFGAYHGKSGFTQFSHARAVYKQAAIDVARPLRPPYGKAFEVMSRTLFRWS